VLPDTPDNCLLIDWTFKSQVLQLRAKPVAARRGTTCNLGNCIYPVAEIRETGLAAATCQVFIRSLS
jgi:hypothetical protein